MSITAAAGALREVLEDLDGLRFYDDLAAVLDPPAVLLGPPALEWGGRPGNGPVNARFLVIVAVAADDRALPRLWELVPQVGDAIESAVDAVVLTATPGSWMSGGTDLPCYELTVEVSL